MRSAAASRSLEAIFTKLAPNLPGVSSLPVAGSRGIRHSGMYRCTRPARTASIHWLMISSKASKASVFLSKMEAPRPGQRALGQNCSGTASITRGSKVTSRRPASSGSASSGRGLPSSVSSYRTLPGA